MEKVKCIERVWCPELGDYRGKFVMNADATKDDLPKCCPGSEAYTIDADMKFFMVDASGEWKEV